MKKKARRTVRFGDIVGCPDCQQENLLITSEQGRFYFRCFRCYHLERIYVEEGKGRIDPKIAIKKDKWLQSHLAKMWANLPKAKLPKGRL